jgi:hypothetical protein
MLGGITLDLVDSVNELGVIIDSKMSFTGHIDVTVGRALAMLGFVASFCLETLASKDANACVMFNFDILSSRVNSSILSRLA